MAPRFPPRPRRALAGPVLGLGVAAWWSGHGAPLAVAGLLGLGGLAHAGFRAAALGTLEAVLRAVGRALGALLLALAYVLFVTPLGALRRAVSPPDAAARGEWVDAEEGAPDRRFWERPW
jgi:hypothetical protein